MLVLASHSPRRRDLLLGAGFEFEIVPATVAERSDVDLTLRELTLWNSRQKAEEVANRRPECVVLAADTLVALDDQVIGKPRDVIEAAEILRRLSGRVHEVCSAVVIQNRARARSTTFHEISRVRFRRLSPEKIEKYLAKVDPLDKAGAYAAQGHGGEIIADIRGSFTNVVGLPMEKTIAALREFGISPAERG